MRICKTAAACALLLALGGQSALAQDTAKEKVLKPKEVTTEGLIDALALPEANASGATRGFRPVAPGEKPKPYGPGKANLLVTFVTGSTQLSAEAEALLDKMAAAMQSDTLAGVAFRVQGHADARGDEARNKELSQGRAEAVVKYLVSKHGILDARLAAEGKGSSEPMNKQRVDAPENRRVTFVSTRDLPKP